jgi:ribulose-phosphate 3-epimerase
LLNDSRLGEETQKMIEFGADTIHVDVMDGTFVPNLTFGAPVVKSLRKFVGSKPFLDCHLMVANPAQWIDDFKTAGASGYTVHVETFGTPGANVFFVVFFFNPPN